MRRSLTLLVLALGFFWIGVGFWLVRQPKIIIVPHHNVVAGIRRQLLSQLSRQRLVTKRVVVLSTDHFGKNQHRLVTTGSNESLFPLAVADNEAIYADHGVMNLVPDIREIFPQAQYYPLILGNEVRISELDQILTSIQTFCGIDCLVIASVDFSHYLPAAIAMTHDEYTLDGLRGLNAQKVFSAETDSPQTLWLATKLAENWQTRRWTTYTQTNSSNMANDPWYESTSHIFGWFGAGRLDQGIKPKTFTITSAKSPELLVSLGKRLTYGVDSKDVPCPMEIAPDTILSGWETDEVIYAGLIGIESTSSGYRWKQQTQHLQPICQKKLILLPGTVN